MSSRRLGTRERARRDKTSGSSGRSSCSEDSRLGPAPCGSFRPILARDLRGMKRSRRSLCQIHLLICRSFTGATGLEPATSGVTGREGHGEEQPLTPTHGVSASFGADASGDGSVADRVPARGVSPSCGRHGGGGTVPGMPLGRLSTEGYAMILVLASFEALRG